MMPFYPSSSPPCSSLEDRVPTSLRIHYAILPAVEALFQCHVYVKEKGKIRQTTIDGIRSFKWYSPKMTPHLLPEHLQQTQAIRNSIETYEAEYPPSQPRFTRSAHLASPSPRSSSIYNPRPQIPSSQPCSPTPPRMTTATLVHDRRSRPRTSEGHCTTCAGGATAKSVNRRCGRISKMCASCC
ncbi:hypothetical protein FRC03_006282 [Tulasnella sp. 419]|nr:hypothetical protein FRC03_006282 [Tulasnella sp. 419]